MQLQEEMLGQQGLSVPQVSPEKLQIEGVGLHPIKGLRRPIHC